MTTAPQQELIVTWRHPQTEITSAVGMLRRDGEKYTFAYSDDVRHVAGFRPLLSFPHYSEVYVSETLFPIFAMRVMSDRRADYAAYLEGLGLPATATAWDQLAASGGRRGSDSLELHRN
jgi:hypothetical protein